MVLEGRRKYFQLHEMMKGAKGAEMQISARANAAKQTTRFRLRRSREGPYYPLLHWRRPSPRLPRLWHLPFGIAASLLTLFALYLSYRHLRAMRPRRKQPSVASNDTDAEPVPLSDSMPRPSSMGRNFPSSQYVYRSPSPSATKHCWLLSGTVSPSNYRFLYTYKPIPLTLW